MVTRAWSHTRVILALIPWLLLPFGLYWWLEPVPVRVVYAAPRFTSVPTISREEAERHAITEATAGAIIYRYVEWCNDRPYLATMRRAWIGTAIVMHAPDYPSALADRVGCMSRPMPIEVPSVMQRAHFEYSHSLLVTVNWLRENEIRHPLIPLTITPAKAAE